jgi:hypothetical protein
VPLGRIAVLPGKGPFEFVLMPMIITLAPLPKSLLNLDRGGSDTRGR